MATMITITTITARIANAVMTPPLFSGSYDGWLPGGEELAVSGAARVP
jgi:hypothetical protein